MKKIIAFFILVSLVSTLTVQSAYAALLPRFRKATKSTKKGSYSGVIITPRLRADRKALNLYFSNLSSVRNITYTLIYQTDGKDEGARGSIDSAVGNSATRELLFGTCSSGVCRYHPNLTNMRLEVVSELPSGKKAVKRFRIRV